MKSFLVSGSKKMGIDAARPAAIEELWIALDDVTTFAIILTE